MNNSNKSNLFIRILHEIRRVIYIMLDEYRVILKDSGLAVVFLGATIVYPILYSSIYRNETVHNMPIAVVDASQSNRSRELARRLDATADLKVAYRFNNLEEVKDAFYRHKIHGVVYIPEDFNRKINRNEQATVSIYCDMSSFLYYRAMMLGANFGILDAGNDIKIERMNAAGITGRTAEISSSPFRYEKNILFNEPMGFASFLMPVVLVLIIHQTLFFGITMLTGSLHEEKLVAIDPQLRQRGKFFPTIFGKTLCYFTLYIVICSYILLAVPRFFQLPHIGNSWDIIRFFTPFLLAVIFFSMLVSAFIRNRETGLVIFPFFSLILLFLSGFSWPMSNMPWFWKTFAMLFPSTFGIQGYLKINSMGAGLSQVQFEYIALWIQVAVYFLATVLAYRLQIRNSKK
ncbi:MAG TPA: ABC transporter permease [Porphyromonadaceae bacterium]|nr:ABC transporter permease [Porphyromonadaceae bacterium]HBL32878.1 ABC transporter permease [Porphyromonadaceae bacterium]HCM20692.1 ABC transporter permease [Porphyromonadaceae bacterium]